MGKLIEQSIETLFQGVSRQPATVRLPGQVEEADNVVFSVVSGGFERRPGSEQVAPLDFLSASTNYAYHTYERDDTEKYYIFVENGDLKVCDIEGDEKTVTFPNGKGYLASSDPSADFSFATVADYTFIANRSIEVKMDTTNLSDDPAICAIVYGKDSYLGNSGRITINGNAYVGGSGDNVREVIDGLYTTLTGGGGLGAGWDIQKADEFLYIARTNGGDFTIAVSTEAGQAYIGHVKRTVQQFSDLPKRAKPGMKVNVIGDRSSDFAGYWVVADPKSPGDTSPLAEVVWRETVAPGIQDKFDATTMPHQLVRNANGTFTFQRTTWEPRKVGDEELVPDPIFIGRTITDIAFTRDRLVLLSGESIRTSQAGDYFNFWPEKALDVLDSDPIERSSPTNRINILRYAVPFRRALFVTSDKQQFELSAPDAFTPRTAKLEAATAYEASPTCRPLAIGDTLYFPAPTGNGEIVWEYIYDDSTLNTVAADVTKHVQGYIPSPVTCLAGDPAGNTLFALTSSDPSAIYVYQVYWDGAEKAQASWGRWVFSDAVLKHADVIDGYLYLVIDHGGSLHLERIPVSNEFSGSGVQFFVNRSDGRVPVRLDRREFVTGTYDAGTNTTTWEVSWESAAGAAVILGNDFTTPGRRLNVTYPDTPGDEKKVRALGNWTAGDVIVGAPYKSAVTLSRIFPREQNRSITTGRLQLRRISFDYKDSSYFRVRCKPRLREEDVWTFTGRIMGDGGNVIGEVPLVHLGTFRVRAKGNSVDLTITVESDDHTPFTITSATWAGFFNEITRQE